MTTPRFLPPDLGNRMERSRAVIKRDEEGYLTVPDAAMLLGISRTSMWRLIRRGLIAFHKFPVGGIRIAPADLDAFKDRYRREPVSYVPTARKARMTEAAFAATTKREAFRTLGRTR